MIRLDLHNVKTVGEYNEANILIKSIRGNTLVNDNFMDYGPVFNMKIDIIKLLNKDKLRRLSLISDTRFPYGSK